MGSNGNLPQAQEQRQQSHKQASTSGWPHTIAGGVGGSAATLLLHPFDVIKTRLQVQDGHQSPATTYRGTWHAIRAMYRQEGWRSFYQGLVPAWIGSGVSWSAYFSAYEAIKRWHMRWQGVDRLSPLWHTLSAAQAGGMVCLMTNPIWLIKTRLQLQHRAGSSSIAGSAAAAATVAAGRAPPALSAALSAAASLPSAASASPAATIAAAASAASAAASSQSGTASSSVSHPHASTARSSAHAHPPSVSPSAAASASGAGKPYKGLIDALARIWKEEGIRGYYKGLGPSLLLQTTHGAVQFTVYEELKHWAASRGPLFSSDSISGSSSSMAQQPGSQQQPASTPGTSASGQSPPAPSPSSSPRAISSFETSVYAAISKLAASITTYPSQVVRSRLQQRFDAGSSRVYRSALEVVALTWRHEGLRGFYKGLGPALVRVMPQSAVTLVVYEHVLQVLQATPYARG